ncbi:SDR family oxidoreductase [Haoranjiania flava]|uniref:SDR family oxidoreductase n=1 Tax=Haoranjiania flava TaxID=1856322 RepID=A0AAE3LL25_9BACT|nr:SDR family oxidoreductase [Haoranjiania flava]MCU7695188.1 SDR family oxidoreductase [Haoranjiania flava]
MKDLKEKVAYITGGSKGIGLGIAKKLAEQGVKVAVSGRTYKDVDAAAKEISADDNSVLAVESDVSKCENEKAAVAKIIEKFGRLDIVIANAGVGNFAPVDELTEEQWHQMIDTNLSGVFHTLKASVEELKKTKGYYITIASLAGTNFFEKGAGYNASKFGVVGFTQAAMLDLRPYDIKVTTIMPGSVSTHFNHHTPSEDDTWKIQPEDIGQMIVDLLHMHPRTLPSKIEVRPAQTKSKQ